MIHESGNISSCNEMGTLKGCIKWKLFIGKRGVGQEAISKKKKMKELFQSRTEGKGTAVVYHANYLTNAIQEISDRLLRSRS